MEVIRKCLWLAALALLTSVAGLGQTVVFNCGGSGTAWSASSGTCGVSVPGGGGLAFRRWPNRNRRYCKRNTVNLVPSSSLTTLAYL